MTKKNTAIATVVVTRQIAAPASDLYRMFTNSSGLREWFCDVATTEPHVGGRLYCAWLNGDALMGQFKALTLDKKMVMAVRAFDDDTDRSTVTVTLREKAGVTTVKLSDTSDGRRWVELEHIVEHAWEEELDNLKSLAETGEDLRITQRPMLGILMDSFDAAVAQKLGVPVKAGVRLSSVIDGLGAQQAGLAHNDVIVRLDGQPTPDLNVLDAILRTHQAGDTLKVVFYRGPEKRTVQMTLSPRPLAPLPASAAEFADALQKTYADGDKALKALLKGVTDAQAEQRPSPDEWNTKQVLAHLICGEHAIQWWIGTLLGGQEPHQDDWEGNQTLVVNAKVAAYGTLKRLLDELIASEAGTVSLVRSLPDAFVARKGTFRRLYAQLNPWTGHAREHLDQIKAALGSSA